MPKKVTTEELKILYSKIDTKEQNYLEQKGWCYTSNTIGSIWMYKKKIDNVTYMVDQRTALRIEATLEEYKED